MNRSSWTRLTTAVLICVLGYSACTGGGAPPSTNTTEAAPAPTAQPPVMATHYGDAGPAPVRNGAGLPKPNRRRTPREKSSAPRRPQRKHTTDANAG